MSLFGIDLQRAGEGDSDTWWNQVVPHRHVAFQGLEMFGVKIKACRNVQNNIGNN